MVHSYAAIAVDKLLSQREGGALRFQPQELAGCLQGLLERLFACFALPDSSENEYVMKAVMRVIAFVGERGLGGAREGGARGGGGARSGDSPVGPEGERRMQ